MSNIDNIASIEIAKSIYFLLYILVCGCNDSIIHQTSDCLKLNSIFTFVFELFCERRIKSISFVTINTMATSRVISRIGSIAAFGMLCGSFNHNRLKCETQQKKYHAWNETWKKHRENKTTPPWDPGYPTTATKFLPQYQQEQQLSVLIPLCGSSHDMDYIQKYYNYQNTKIIGIELSEQGIKAFLERVMINDDDSFWIEYDNNVPIYRYSNYYLIHSDIFNESLNEMELLKNINLIYDKESLSALPPSKWNIYIKFCEKILAQHGKILLTTWRYDTNKRDIEQRYTTPYSFGFIETNDVNKLFESILGHCKVKLLYTENWNECKDTDYYKLKANHLGINEVAYTDVWLIYFGENR